MKKLELQEVSLSAIFSLSYISDIILDKENKTLKMTIYESPLIEMFLKEKFKTNSIIFIAQDWDNVLITLVNKETEESTEINTLKKIKGLMFVRKENEKTIFYGPTIEEVGNWIEITCTKLLYYGFYEKE